MARPSGTLSLSATDPVGLSVNRCWLVTADADVVDLKASGPTLVRTSSPAYNADSDIGASFAGQGGYCQANESSALITATGYRCGAIFRTLATKSQGTGVETIFSVGSSDVQIGSGADLFAFVIDDGTLGFPGSAAGKIAAIWRPARYGTLYCRYGPVVSANTTYFVTHRLSQWSDLLSVNNVDYTGSGMGGGSWTGGPTLVSLGCMDAYNSAAQWFTSTTTRVAGAWVDFTGASDVSDAQAKAWSLDGWAMFTASGGGGGTTTKKILVNVVNTSGALMANQSGIKWAFWDETTPEALTYPVNVGTLETTDGSGQLEILVPDSTKSNGQTGFLVVSNTDGTTTQNPSANSFAGPVTVTVTTS